MFKIPDDISFDGLLSSLSGSNRDSYRPPGNSLYPCVPVCDLEPVMLIAPDYDRGPWIAGGAALQWYQGQPVGLGDIDVFCRSEQQAQSVLADVNAHRNCVVRHRTDNAITVEMRCDTPGQPDWRIQVIIAHYYPTLQAVIDNFDITVCQIGTAGSEWVLGPDTALDIRHRVLRMPIPLREGAVKRLLKYWTYGYEPTDGLVEAIAAAPTTRWEFDPSEDYK